MQKLSALAAICIFCTTVSCSTTIKITSNPPGANVFINDKLVGNTPITLERSNFIFKQYKIKLELKDYNDIDSYLEKEVKVGSLVGGIFVYLPLLWCYGPQEDQHYTLMKNKKKALILNKNANVVLLIDGREINSGMQEIDSGYHAISCKIDNKIFNYKPVFFKPNGFYEVN